MPKQIVPASNNAADDDEPDGAGKDASKSSGLKRIAKQVIDIIKSRPYMSYPQVAYFVVQ